MLTGLAVAGGWVIDRVAGEPPVRLHPVVHFGRAMTALEARVYRPTRTAGLVHASIGVGAAVIVGRLAERATGKRVAVAAATAVSVAGRMLANEAAGVLAALDAGRLDDARVRVRALVGRDPDDLDADEIARAVIESIAENSVDAVTAPLFWAAVAGAPGVLAHRAINTLDAMVGHRSARYERFGTVAARADDVANYVPARLTALVIAVLAPGRARSIWRTVRRDAGAHPSPNGGVVEAAMAAALGVRLGGANRYGDRIEDRGVLGDGPPPSIADGHRANRIAVAAGAIVAGVIAVVR